MTADSPRQRFLVQDVGDGEHGEGGRTQEQGEKINGICFWQQLFFCRIFVSKGTWHLWGSASCLPMHEFNVLLTGLVGAVARQK